MKYKILSAETTEGLEDIVNLALSEGWTLAGGFLHVAARGFKDIQRFHQAMMINEAQQPKTMHKGGKK